MPFLIINYNLTQILYFECKYLFSHFQRQPIYVIRLLSSNHGPKIQRQILSRFMDGMIILMKVLSLLLQFEQWSLQIQFYWYCWMNTVNKIFTCLCCSQCACEVACCIDQWAAVEACGLAQLQCGHCCWRVCAPICHSCTLGSFSEAMPFCSKGIKYCLYSCALSCVSPIDGCYNCIQYDMEVCGSGVTGFGDMLKKTKWLNEKVRNFFELTNGSEPEKTFGEYRI